MSDPVVPNYKKNVGRLVTDRFDFQDHKDGYNFRHQADQVDLFPKIAVDGYTKSTVQEALVSIAELVPYPPLPDATVSSKGIIKLSGDISGTADSITVNKIQGKPINTLVPTIGDTLTWNGISWTPSAPVNVFSAGEDLSGSNVSQKVVKITGDLSGEVLVPASTFTFNENSIPLFKQENATSNNGNNFTINAQNSLAGDGGNVLISGGFSGFGAAAGGVTLSLESHASKMLQISQFSDSRRIIALFGESEITDTEVPDGDMMLYIKDAASDPLMGTPSQGVLVYSTNGKLNIKQSDGTEVIVGSIPNPSIWGDSGEQTYTIRSKSQTVTNSAVTAFSYLMPNDSSVKVDVIVVGKEVGSAKSYQVNMSAGYCINSVGAVTVMGATTNYDIRNTGGTSLFWSPPSITNTGATLNVITGSFLATTINWLMITQLSIVGD